MSEKFAPSVSHENSSADITLSDIQEQVDLGSYDDAHRLAAIKLDLLQRTLEDIKKAIVGETGMIPKEEWRQEQIFTEEQITDLKDLLKKIPHKV